ncbi:MAG: WXG100 family type VII secretion target, partial [Anaerolineae bacterium]|nr:WXG100 family type VII secretion target [Anaerolineae bacterium]
MGAPRIQADYDGLREIAQTFTRNADGLNTMNQRLSHMVNNEIRGKGWIGRGADQFIREMETLIFPALSRLLGALNEAASATQKIAQTFERAEQEGGALFQGGESFNQIADNVISNLMGQNSTFNSIAQGIINSLGGGAGTSGGLVDKIIRGTGGMNTDFNGLV